MNNPLYEALRSKAKALGTSESPSTYTWRFDYGARTDLQPVYHGWGLAGVAEGDSKWIIYEYTYNADGSVSDRKIAIDVDWTNRASHTYV